MCMVFGYVYGFLISSSELINQLSNLIGYTGFRAYSENNTYTLDISKNSSLIYVQFGSSPYKSYILGKELKNIEVEGFGNYVIEDNLNLEEFFINCCNGTYTMKNHTQNGITTLSIGANQDWAGKYSLNHFKSLLNNGIKDLRYYGYNRRSGKGIGVVDCKDDFDELTWCTSIYITYSKISNLDGEYIPATLTSLTLNNCELTNIFDVNNTNIENLNLSSNKIVDISSLRFIESDSVLTELDLSNNILQNTFSYKDESGNIVTSNTAEFLANVPNLKTIKLSENTDLTDFSALTNAGFVNDGSNNFTRN